MVASGRRGTGMTPDNQHRLDAWQLARALAGAALALLAAIAYAPAFGTDTAAALTDPRYAGILAGAAAAVTGVCILLRAGTAAAPVYRVAAAIAAQAAYVWLVVSPGWGIAAGPKRLLSTALPIEPTGPELATVVIVVGLATLAAVEPALRRRGPLPQVAAPPLATAAGCAVSASAGPPPAWLAPAAALGIAGVLALARYAPEPKPPAGTQARPAAPHRTHSGPVRRGQVGTLRLIAAALTLGLLATVATIGWYGPRMLASANRSTPVDARDLVDQTVTPRLGTSPLAMFSALRSGRRTLSLTVTAIRRPDLLRYVSLDRFNGTSWTTDARYRRAGRWLPAGPPSPGEHHDEEVVVLDGDVLGWLVASGRPVEVSVAGLGVDETSGDVALPADSPVPKRYTVRSIVPAAGQDAIERATPADAAAVPDLPVPVELVEWARHLAGTDRGHIAL